MLPIAQAVSPLLLHIPYDILPGFYGGRYGPVIKIKVDNIAGYASDFIHYLLKNHRLAASPDAGDYLYQIALIKAPDLCNIFFPDDQFEFLIFHL